MPRGANFAQDWLKFYRLLTTPVQDGPDWAMPRTTRGDPGPAMATWNVTRTRGAALQDRQDSQKPSTRRALLRQGAGIVLGSVFSTLTLGNETAAAYYRPFNRPAPRAFPLRRRSEVRQIAFQHMHTGEKLSTVYWVDGKYQPGALSDINHLLRDFRTEEVKPIDPALLDLLYAVRQRLGTGQPFQVVSAYRSAKTNAMLAEISPSVATNSLHMEGMAIDIRLPDRPLASVRQVALDLRAGGVGHYPHSDFIHLDTGRIRQW